MRTEKNNHCICAYLEGRIDSSNAAMLQKELETIRNESPGCELVLDAGTLEYISSAGLRVLLQIRREQGSLTVWNITPEVYDILDMTGFTGLLNVKRKMRELSVEGCEIVGRGAIGTVYRLDDDTSVKVYERPDSLPMIENEQQRAKQAFLKGIPTAISYDVVKVGEKYGSVFEMLKAITYNDYLIENPDKRDEIVRNYACFIRSIHTVEMESGELPPARDAFLGYMDSLREYLPGDLYTRLRSLFEAMPENQHIVHGDIQMKNVMLSGNEPMLIDMDTLAVGDPVFDLMGLCVAYPMFNEDEPDNSQKFLGITGEMCDFVYRKTLEYYFSDLDAAVIREAEKKVRLVAYVRFLYLVAVLGIGLPELRRIRLEHTIGHMQELAAQVDSLDIAGLYH